MLHPNSSDGTAAISSPSPLRREAASGGGGLVIEARGISKRYGSGKGLRQVLDDVTFSVARGEFLAIVGPSGCGKSTLLGISGCLDRDYRGALSLFGEPTRPLRDPQLAALRSRHIGFVFQAFHLLGHLSTRDNVLAPALFARRAPSREALHRRADTLLAEVGLAGRGDDGPAQLSGGERQRVAIARALLMQPELLLCDEPTGNLDEHTGQQITDLFCQLHAERGLTVVAVTHEAALANSASRVLQLRAGKLLTGDTPAAPEAA